MVHLVHTPRRIHSWSTKWKETTLGFTFLRFKYKKKVLPGTFLLKIQEQNCGETRLL